MPAAFVRDPLYFYFDDRAGEALRYGEAILQEPSTPRSLRNQVLVTIATIRVAQRQEQRARQAFMEMLSDDPTADLEAPSRLPPPVCRLFYRMRDSLCLARREELLSSGQLASAPQTLALGDIENNSIVKADYDTDRLCRGLVQVLITDLQGATSLKLVDRQRLSVLMEELELNRDPSRMDAESRVRLGQLCGAQSYLFGQFMQLDSKLVRMDLRWVDTATGEVLLAEGIQQRIAKAEDLFELEKKLLVDLLAPRIQKLVDSTRTPADLQKRIQKYLENKRRSLPRGTSYLTLTEATGRAIASEESGDLEGAAGAWQRVSKMSPSDTTASVRAKSLAAYQKLRES